MALITSFPGTLCEYAVPRANWSDAGGRTRKRLIVSPLLRIVKVSVYIFPTIKSVKCIYSEKMRGNND